MNEVTAGELIAAAEAGCAEALALYRDAAQSGNATALYELATMYEQGYGVPKDTDEVLRLYTESAAEGNEQARERLRDILGVTAHIKNVIFDFGQVLVRFDPAYIVSCHTSDPEIAPLLCDVVFDLAYWSKLDAGEVSDDEAVAEIRRRLPPALRDLGEQVFRSWIDHLPPIRPMWKLVERLHARGVPLYLLSNISTAFAERAGEFPIFRHFCHCVFSGPCRMAKPDPAIYRHLLNTCGIAAEDTLFIDDSEKNIAGAASVGIHGYLFDGDADRLAAYLEAVLL